MIILNIEHIHFRIKKNEKETSVVMGLLSN